MYFYSNVPKNITFFKQSQLLHVMIILLKVMFLNATGYILIFQLRILSGSFRNIINVTNECFTELEFVNRFLTATP